MAMSAETGCQAALGRRSTSSPALMRAVAASPAPMPGNTRASTAGCTRAAMAAVVAAASVAPAAEDMEGGEDDPPAPASPAVDARASLSHAANGAYSPPRSVSDRSSRGSAGVGWSPAVYPRAYTPLAAAAVMATPACLGIVYPLVVYLPPAATAAATASPPSPPPRIAPSASASPQGVTPPWNAQPPRNDDASVAGPVAHRNRDVVSIFIIRFCGPGAL
mmetsp:Transcript_12534/g.30412  ORF Transcript_12534/g.30412 Transcript_12534/m.30412 type:complete len:220 (-) Transcript_12534:577-1236(-)